VLSQKKVLVVGPLDEVAEFNDPWVQAYFHGPRGRAAEEAHPNGSSPEVK
jgi:phospholipid/cholesterol/gamma-HCH transport system ATP-binding protein